MSEQEVSDRHRFLNLTKPTCNMSRACSVHWGPGCLRQNTEWFCCRCVLLTLSSYLKSTLGLKMVQKVTVNLFTEQLTRSWLWEEMGFTSFLWKKGSLACCAKGWTEDTYWLLINIWILEYISKLNKNPREKMVLWSNSRLCLKRFTFHPWLFSLEKGCR